MKLLSYGLLSCLLHLISSNVYAEINWSFSIETPNFVVSPTDSFSVIGKITNFSSSSSALSIYEPCPLCVFPVGMFIGASDSKPFDVFLIDQSPTSTTLPGLSLNPGESFSFTAYTISPLNGAVPTGSYDFIVNDLFIQPYGFSSGGPVHIAVVPEPSASVLMFAGLGILGIALHLRKAYA
ncbi:PEP-CTERM sorting domain-containing protein [Thiobacillus sp.]|nr:PEP-CTERM sorting domain-containing protein [Thiobacillus sp.]MBT9538471.1 PEP-CTERM sorting domain-containing protein [Thiobacillus sp.]